MFNGPPVLHSLTQMTGYLLILLSEIICITLSSESIKEVLSCKHLIYSDSSKQLPSTVMSSNARGSSISSLQATQSSSMESLESSMSTTESTIGVCPCARMRVSMCTYVCVFIMRASVGVFRE